jgi:hypothetical protein
MFPEGVFAGLLGGVDTGLQRCKLRFWSRVIDQLEADLPIPKKGPSSDGIDGRTIDLQVC